MFLINFNIIHRVNVLKGCELRTLMGWFQSITIFRYYKLWMELKKYDLLTNSCIGRQEVKGNKYAFITVVSYYQINIKCQYQLFSVFRKLREKPYASPFHVQVVCINAIPTCGNLYLCQNLQNSILKIWIWH